MKIDVHNSTELIVSKCKKWIPALRIMALVLIAVGMIATSIYVYRVTMQPKFIMHNYGVTNDRAIGEIIAGVTIRQSFTADQPIDGISLLMATYGRKNSGEISVMIKDITNQTTLYDHIISADTFTDNTNYPFVFSNISDHEGVTQYEISISSRDAEAGKALTIWSSSADGIADGVLFINNVKQNGDLVLSTFNVDNTYRPIGLFLCRLLLIVLFFPFIALHILINIRKLYAWIFKRRVILALAVLVILVVNQFNFSSIGMYDSYIQSGQGSEFIQPVWGQPRSIRSDEWLVSTPSKLSAQYSDYGPYNSILRAAKTSNLSASGLYFHYSALAKPLNWGYYLLGTQYGFSFYWVAFIALTFLFSFEMALILTRRNKLLSLLGATLITFSGYFLWWSFVGWVMTGQAALVFAYYFINTDKWWKRVLCGIGMAVFVSNFVVELYPAWQVPAGLLYLGILIWILISDRDKLKQFKKSDWCILALSLLFMASITGIYLYTYRDYMKAVMSTVYPGARVSYGGFSINKLFNYLGVLLYPFKAMDNPSEASTFLSLYPIPTILAIYAFIKNKGKDLLSGILLFLSLFMTVYCLVDIPPIIAKIFLMTYSTPIRMADILGFIQIYLLIISLSRLEGQKKINSFCSWIIAIAAVEVAVYFFKNNLPEFFTNRELIFAANIFIVLCVVFLTDINKKIMNILIICIICVSIVSGLFVNPVMRGLDVIYSKPAAHAISNILERDSGGKWISVGGHVDSGFLVSCGAPTINSVNYIPNFELWNILDPNGQYNEIYNRYAHITIELVPSDTKPSLIQADYLMLSLSYKDMKKIGIKYIFTQENLEDNEYLSFILLYSESGCNIYEADYH